MSSGWCFLRTKPAMTFVITTKQRIWEASLWGTTADVRQGIQFRYGTITLLPWMENHGLPTHVKDSTMDSNQSSGVIIHRSGNCWMLSKKTLKYRKKSSKTKSQDSLALQVSHFKPAGSINCHHVWAVSGQGQVPEVHGKPSRRSCHYQRRWVNNSVLIPYIISHNYHWQNTTKLVK